jgi:hypothetical protein
MKGQALRREVKFFRLKIAILKRMQSFLAFLKVYTFFSMVLFVESLSIFIMHVENPVLSILYIVASFFGTITGYYGVRDCNYYTSSIHITMVISQIIILSLIFLHVIVEDFSNHKWSLSLISSKLIINTFLIANSIWCMIDFPSRIRDDSKLL